MNLSPPSPLLSLPLCSSLLRCPSIPQVLASLRTVRSNFTILANVTTPTNKSVSCCQTPLPPTYTRHDCLLSLQCVFADVSFSLFPWGNTFTFMINQFMIIRLCLRKIRSALFGISPTRWLRSECRECHASDVCP